MIYVVVFLKLGQDMGAKTKLHIVRMVDCSFQPWCSPLIRLIAAIATSGPRPRLVLCALRTPPAGLSARASIRWA